MGSTRIKGIALKLSLGSPATDYWADVSKLSITNEAADGDVTTFEDAAGAGSRKWLMNITAIQSTDAASLWSYIWENSGETVAFVYAPHGNTTPTASQPHFTGTVKIGAKPDIGGEAGSSTTYTFETQWELTTEPTKVITGS